MRFIKYKHILLLAACLSVVFGDLSMVFADDMRITGPINDTQTYDSMEGIVFENAVLAPTAKVNAIYTFEVYLKPGTRIAKGAQLVIENRDNDGLPNRWELEKCRKLDYKRNDDPDSDTLSMIAELHHQTHPCDPDTDDDGMPDGWEVLHGLDPLVDDAAGDPDLDAFSNLAEYLAGTDPNVPDLNDSDTDGDGIPDAWEMTMFGNLSHNCDTDSNDDGVYDCVEYRLGRDPNDSSSRGPGIYYQYDKLGRIKKIERIPTR